MSSFWDRKKVLITGGAGFVGSHVAEALLQKSPSVEVTAADNLQNGTLKNLAALHPRIRFLRLDLRNYPECLQACEGREIILNLAARVGGIRYNRDHQGLMFRDNMIIHSHMLEAARICKTERFLLMSSACVYPTHCSIPTPEEEGFRDRPEETNEGYGWAKRMAEFQAAAYQKEDGMRIEIARPTNTYGPRDHFDPSISHVIPALIQRILEGENPVRVWGSGKQSRVFIYVKDLVQGLLALIERCPGCGPVNIGTDEEIEIGNLVSLLLELTGGKAEIRFDPSQPSGQPRRNCDTSKAKRLLGFVAQTPLKTGLQETIAWVRENLKKSSAV